MASRKQTCYDVLGVPRTAKLTDVTRAYNRLKSELTRDNAMPDLKRETLIREAYETLADNDRRERYDASLVAPDRRHRSRLRAAWIGALGATVAGSWLLFAKPPAQAIAAPRFAHEILAEVSPAIGRVHAIDVGGNSIPVGMAFAIADGVLVTTCGSLSPSSQIVLQIPPRKIPARVAIVDNELGLCRLTAQGVGARPLDLAVPAKMGDLVYAAKVDTKGVVHITEAKLKNIGFDPQRNIRLYDAGASGITGAPLLDAQGRVIGVATDGDGRHIPVPPEWIAEARDPLRNQKTAVEVVAPPAKAEDVAATRRERLEKAYAPPQSIEDEIAKMK